MEAQNDLMESWFDDIFGDGWRFWDGDDSFMRFAEFVYENVSFEVAENT